MIAELAHYCLVLSFALAVSGIVATYRIAPALRLHIALIPLTCLLSFGLLISLFVQSDFSVQYVANNSSSLLPTIYQYTAVWGAHEGSLLLWILILALLGYFAVTQVPAKSRKGIARLYFALLAGFLLLILSTSNPFLRFLPIVPEQGADLNPLLQDFGFVIHPPVLYCGYVGFAIPFMFAMNAKALAQQGINWVEYARPWALLAQGFLTLGIALGSWWAYYELGWGGWWFWDPVENASFMPWLTGVALNHVLLLSSKKQRFEGLALVLAIVTFTLCLMGTFLVRSGVLVSVHSFAADPARGTAILMLTTVVVLYAAFNCWKILPFTTSHKPLGRLDQGLLLGIMLLLSSAFTVLLGTLYPLFYQVAFAGELSIGIPYFKLTFVPIAFLVLIVYTITYTPKYNHRYIAISLLIAAMGFYWIRDLVYTLMACLCVLVMLRAALSFMKWPVLRQLPPHLAHFGLGVAALGMVLTTALSIETEQALKPGASVSVGQYSLVFSRITEEKGPNYESLMGHFSVNKGQYQLKPEKRLYQPSNMVITETAILPGFWQDIYIAIGEQLNDHSVAVRIHVKPFIRWVWLGAILIAMASLLRAIQLLKEHHGKK